MIMRQWHATTTRHSYTLMYQFFTDLRTFLELLRDIQFGLPLRSDNNYMCHECIHVTRNFTTTHSNFSLETTLVSQTRPSVDCCQHCAQCPFLPRILSESMGLLVRLGTLQLYQLHSFSIDCRLGMSLEA